MNRSRFRSRFASLALLGALTFGPACSKGDDPSKAADKPADKKSAEPEQPKITPPTDQVASPTDSPAVAETGEVVATVQLPTGTKMTDVAKVLDSVQPGTSMMLAMLPAQLEEAAGFDLDKSAKLDAPMSFVIVDPSSHPKPLALLVQAEDAAALTEAAKGAGHAVEQRGDTLLIGPEDVVSAAKDFAFSNLTKYPDHTEIIVYPQQLMRSYAGAIEGGIQSLGGIMAAQGAENMTQVFQAYFKGIVSLVEQTERVVISLSSTPNSADLVARIYPVANSQLASFIGAQVASDYALVSKLPSGGGAVLMAGDFRAGPVRDALVEFGAGIMGPMYAGMSVEDWKAMLGPWFDNFDGRLAMSMNMSLDPSKGPPVAYSAIYGATDSEALRAGWRAMMAKMSSNAVEMMGMKITSKHEPKALEHDGVEIDFYSSTVDTSALPAAQAAAIERAKTANTTIHFAAFDKFAALATASDDGQAIRATIDAARGKGSTLELSPALASAIDASKQRGDSWLMYMDIGTIMANAPTPPPQPLPFKGVSVSVSKQGAALGLRISLSK